MTQEVLPSVYRHELDTDYDGRTRLGTWWIGTNEGFLAMTLSADPASGQIHGSVHDRIVISMARPSAAEPVVVSEPFHPGEHQVVVYAQTIDGGTSLSTDVFVDGYSLATGDPESVIAGRRGAVAAQLAAPEAARRSMDRFWLVSLAIYLPLVLAAGARPGALLVLPYLLGAQAVSVFRPQFRGYARASSWLVVFAWLAWIFTGH